jgi:uncharacterized protein with PIN domain
VEPGPKLYLDEDISAIVAGKLRRAGWDVLTTHQARRCASDDWAQLEYAAGQGRVLVTRNYADFLAIHRRFLELHKPHRGIIVCLWRPSAQVMIERLVAVLRSADPARWDNLLLIA